MVAHGLTCHVLAPCLVACQASACHVVFAVCWRASFGQVVGPRGDLFGLGSSLGSLPLRNHIFYTDFATQASFGAGLV